MNDFEGLVAIVTGGAGAIGSATAKLLKSRGAQVAVLDIKPDGLPDGIMGIGPTSLTMPRSSPLSMPWSSGSAGWTSVVNNAGIGAVGDVTGNGDDEW